MRFANVNGNKLEAQPKLKGVCPHCLSEVIAKCGRVKVWHWAHKGSYMCDSWWENETEWHRNWKNNFPKDWQEISHIDHSTDERHIADIKNPYGLIIEFQHSTIKPEERDSREQFYSDLIWIVDGTRGSLDKQFFNMGLSGPIQDNPLAYKIEWHGRSRLLHNWTDSKVKVYLDFGEDVLWQLICFDVDTQIGAVGPIGKKILIDDCLNGKDLSVSMVSEDTNREEITMPKPLKKIN